ncbi:hypothetical protein [Roseococcus pinisoli]|uniref:Uncharacterized protein n=1 Tax=Roseococcus pinisoli TaxID=2835040 RepID=A0ABS5QCE4_9PROT|nr:hypothetical protein [Roseococcus pinisoli]MBS7811187.1 hypothetical protein [Roseococcus pinisoli]
MRALNFLKVELRAGDPQTQDFGARLLRGDVFGGVDATGRALSKAPRAALADTDVTGEERETPLPAVLGDVVSDSGLGGSRHVRGQLGQLHVSAPCDKGAWSKQSSVQWFGAQAVAAACLPLRAARSAGLVATTPAA